MDFLSIILLKVIKRFDAQRSLYGALHILNGKKSVQAIQDSRLFHIESMYGLLRFLTREMVKDCAHRLERELLIEHIGNDYFQITKKGKAVIEEECKKRTIPQFHHFNYELNELFWKRLALTIQSITSLKVKKEFVPVIKDKKTQQWVKTLFITNRVGREKLNNQLYKEIKTILSGFSELEATIFVMRMTGPVRIGFTIEQISYLLNEDPIYIHVLFQAVIQG
ncbi:MAG: hypothetical protein LRY71_19580 [Bacillaceae bacterium]|nr:hypothetical protein [Bacillaceae bacterium]